MSKIKMCGITNAQDALWAANLGADFIGLNFYGQSPRKVSVKHAKELASQIPPFVSIVGIFVDEPMKSLTKIVKVVPLKIVQLHGMEVPEYCRQVKDLGAKIIKVLRLGKPLEADDTAPYESIVDYFMFDTYSTEAPGGTGVSFNWDWLEKAARLTKPWFLAGGLTPDNVAQAVQKTRAPMVDVCSGIEKSPTRKDYDKMKTFIQKAKA